jgi:hypothetical protein
MRRSRTSSRTSLLPGRWYNPMGLQPIPLARRPDHHQGLLVKIRRMARGLRNHRRRKAIELLVTCAASQLFASTSAKAIAKGQQPRADERLMKKEFVQAICDEVTPNGKTLASRWAFVQLRERWQGCCCVSQSVSVSQTLSLSPHCSIRRCRWPVHP